MESSLFFLVAVIAGGLFLLWMILYFIPIGLWFQALVSDVKISLLQLVLMRWRKVPPTVIVRAMIEGKKAGLELYRDLLEAHYLAGGHVAQVVHALVSASKANIDLTFQIATAVDLAGRDVFEAVQMSVNPKVINTPPVAAVAKDGIQLIAKARVTVRANIRQLVGGAGEETILARVGEGMEQRGILQSLVDEAYDQFVGIVADGRKMDKSAVKKIADGRIYSAKQAKEINLVDEVGSLKDEKKAFAKEVGFSEDITYYTPEKDSLSGMFSSIFGAVKDIVPKSDIDLAEDIVQNNGNGVLKYYAK